MSDWFENNCKDMLKWFETERSGRFTSFTMLCRKFCMMKDMQGVRDTLVARGKICKFKSGYKLIKEKGDE